MVREPVAGGHFHDWTGKAQFASSFTEDSIFYRVIPRRGVTCEERGEALQIVVTDGLPWTNLALSFHDRHAEQPFPPLS